MPMLLMIHASYIFALYAMRPYFITFTMACGGSSDSQNTSMDMTSSSQTDSTASTDSTE